MIKLTEKNTSSKFNKVWPNYLVNCCWAFTFSAIFINVIIVSNILWPGEEFHSLEIGLMFGISTWMTAISGLIFGNFADKYSRKNLLALVIAMYGLMMVMNGFIPEGKGLLTFGSFFAYTVLRGFFSGGFQPITFSYINDLSEEDERSKIYGAIQAIFQVFQIIGMVVSAWLFENLFWREFFWGMGLISIILGILILIKAVEPKRGMMQNGLKEVLASEQIEYKYKLNKESFFATILTPTNIIAFVEGIFTTIIISVSDFLITPYLQSPPNNLSPVVLSVQMILFGLIGGILGSIGFAKLSDKLGKRNIRYRVLFIALSMVSMFVIYLMFFSLPLPGFTKEQGKNIAILWTSPALLTIGFMILIFRVFLGVYNINQPPILQKINLPEVQGKISSANQFLEMIGSGLGPIISGFLLSYYNQNYQIVVLITMSIGLIGAVLWALAALWIKKDVHRIDKIIEKRASELLKSKSNLIEKEINAN